MKTKQHKQDIGYGNQCLSEENLFFFITQATISLILVIYCCTKRISGVDIWRSYVRRNDIMIFMHAFDNLICTFKKNIKMFT